MLVAVELRRGGGLVCKVVGGRGSGAGHSSWTPSRGASWRACRSEACRPEAEDVRFAFTLPFRTVVKVLPL